MGILKLNLPLLVNASYRFRIECALKAELFWLMVIMYKLRHLCRLMVGRSLQCCFPNSALLLMSQSLKYSRYTIWVANQPLFCVNVKGCLVSKSRWGFGKLWMQSPFPIDLMLSWKQQAMEMKISLEDFCNRFFLLSRFRGMEQTKWIGHWNMYACDYPESAAHLVSC